MCTSGGAWFISKANIAPGVFVVAIADTGAALRKLPSSLNGTRCTAIHLYQSDKFCLSHFQLECCQ
jgi:hypothetical protein